MTDQPRNSPPPRRLWPWLVLAAVVLGIVLFALWLWFEVQHVRRIKSSTQGLLHPSHKPAHMEG